MSGIFVSVKTAIANAVAIFTGSGGAGNVGYTPAGTGAVATTVQSKLRESVSVKDFGAVGDGITNDTDAFAAASAYITAKGGGKLVVPEGVYVVGKQTFAGVSGLNYAYKASDIINIQNCTNPVVIEFQGAIIRMAAGLRFGSFDPVTGAVYNPALPFTNRDYIADLGYMVYVGNNANVSITGAVELDGNSENMMLGGVWGNTGRQIVAYGITAYGNDILSIENVLAHHHCTDGIAIGYIGLTELSAPRPASLTNVTCDYNCRQGLSVVGSIGLTATNCIFSNTGKGAFASAPGAGLDLEAESSVIRDALFIGCQFINNTGAAMVADSGDTSGVTFSRCKFIGTTSWALWPNKPRMAFRDCLIVGGIVNAYDSTINPDDACKFYNCLLTDDVALSPTGAVYSTGYVVDLSGAYGVLFSDCTITATTRRLVYGVGIIFRNSTFIVKVGTDLLADQQLVATLSYCTIDGLKVLDRITANIPKVGYRLNMGNCISQGINWIDSPGLKIRWFAPNTTGAYLGQYPGEAFPFASLSIGKSYGGSLSAAYYGAIKIVAWNAVPPLETWLKGDRCINSSPAVGAAKGWVCTVSGTAGTLASGTITGAITIGSPTLTVSSASGITVGCYLVVAGAVTVASVISIAGLTITLSANATATVSGAAVSFYAPTWVSEGNL